SYDEGNRRSTLTLPNGITVTYGYDNADQLTSIVYQQGGTTLGDLSYTYDAAGRRVGVGGSLARTELPAAVASASYDANNRLINWNGTPFSYDDNGNLTSDGTTTYTWDARDRLASLSGGADASFQYDPLGRRTRKTIAGTTTQFLYDRVNVAQELDNGGTATANCIPVLAIDEFFARSDAMGTRYPLADALGSIVELTDAAAVLQTHYTYEAYCESSAAGQANASSYQYTGRENDGTGLYYY